MTTQSNTLPEPFESRGIAPAAMSTTRPLYWSVRRELWENRSIYIAPLAVATLFLFGFMISIIHLPAKMRALSGLDLAQQREAIAAPYDISAALLMITQLLVAAFYCLDALHSEKSLPVSDLTTVLSKTSIPLVVVPLVTFAVTVGLQFIMLLLSSAVLLGSGLNPATLWTQLSFVQMSLLLLYHLVTVHTLWPAPIYGWLMLVSGWARRAALLWAVLPLVAIGVFEKIVFHTSYLAAILEKRISGGGTEAVTMPGSFPMDPTTHVTAGNFLTSPGLWIGLAVMALFLVAAVRLRRYQGPI
ncbi:MAG: ABC transporter permease [Acidobacteria bacterium]|nr:MAG: ABC transporter permease [Acidobacteriota bacterium]